MRILPELQLALIQFGLGELSGPETGELRTVVKRAADSANRAAKLSLAVSGAALAVATASFITTSLS